MTESVKSLNARASLPGSGITLNDLLAQQKRLAFSTVVDYLNQLSEAIDLAHEQGFIHRNINPSTILLTAEGHVVILGLRSADSRKHPRFYRREARWASYGDPTLMTLAYMAPEQMLEGELLAPDVRHFSNIAGMDRSVDGRADLYSLGVILYQMVTGVLPFQAETPEQVALKHLRVPPPSPRQLRLDLPLAAEQAMLRALAKRPTDRYVRAQDLATAFGVALMAAGVLPIEPADASSLIPTGNEASASTLRVSRSEKLARSHESGVLPFEPADAKRSHESGVAGAHFKEAGPHFKVQPDDQQDVDASIERQPAMALQAAFQYSHDDVDEGQPTNPIPVVKAIPSPSTENTLTPLSPRTRQAFVGEPLSPTTQDTFSSLPESPVGADGAELAERLSILRPSPIHRPASPTPSVLDSTSTGAQPAVTPPEYDPISPLPATSTTGMLAVSNVQQGNTGTLKLTGPAKIVQVPVAGQPGMYVTGLLPVFPPQPPSSATSTGTINHARASGVVARLIALTQARIILTLAVLVILVVFGSGLFWLIHSHSNQANKQSTVTVAPNLNATATAKAEASAHANEILIDPLSQNIHNWPIQTTGSMIYVFKDNAYHVTDNNPTQGAPAILPDEILHGSFAYTLTMEEIRGDDTSINNEFGMIVRANSQNKNGKTITMFYSFEVLNTKSGEYQFWKYDNSKGSSVTPWTKLWHQSFGKEFHQGQGPRSINTFKIFVNGKSFTLIVNGKQIATVQDNSCTASLCSSGAVGMLVNLKGTEVAFSNLRLTYS